MGKAKIEYKLVRDWSTASEFEERINSIMQDGWVPIGGIMVVSGGESEYDSFFQAMVRNIVEPSEPKLSDYAVGSKQPVSKGS